MPPRRHMILGSWQHPLPSSRLCLARKFVPQLGGTRSRCLNVITLNKLRRFPHHLWLWVPELQNRALSYRVSLFDFIPVYKIVQIGEVKRISSIYIHICIYFYINILY